MGSFMDAFKNFFGMSSPIASNESNYVGNPEELLPYSKNISLLLHFKEIGDELEQILSGTEVKKQSILDALQKGEELCEAQKVGLDSLEQYPQYANLVKEMLGLSPPDTAVDHANLSESNLTTTLQSMVRYYNILEKLFAMVPFSDDASKQFEELTSVLTSSTNEYQSFFPVFAPFKKKEAKLTADINNFTDQISKIKSQNPFSTDFGGRQAELTKVHAELTKQRDDYVKEEDALNAAISSFAQSLAQTHAMFAAMLQQLFTEINVKEGVLLSLKQELDAFYQNQNSILEALLGTKTK